jgi:hypothetical protein
MSVAIFGPVLVNPKRKHNSSDFIGRCFCPADGQIMLSVVVQWAIITKRIRMALSESSLTSMKQSEDFDVVTRQEAQEQTWPASIFLREGKRELRDKR